MSLEASGGGTGEFIWILQDHPVIFIGADISSALGYPTGHKLVAMLLDDPNWVKGAERTLKDMTSGAVKNHGRPKAIALIREYPKREGSESQRDKNPPIPLKMILEKIHGRWLVATTNWDLELDRAFKEESVINKTSKEYEKGSSKDKRFIVVKLNGDIGESIVLPGEDNESQKRLYENVFVSASGGVVVLGYSTDDKYYKDRINRLNVRFALTLTQEQEFKTVLAVTRDRVDFYGKWCSRNASSTGGKSRT